jgi:branched-chain amino acid transport system substrate-binding protein
MRIRGNVLVIALVVLGVAAGLTGLVHGDDAFRIGVIQPITGPWAYDGLRVVDGAKVAVEMINAAGGVNGKRITLIVEDNKGAPTDSVSAAEKLISRDGVSAIIGAWASSATLAVMPVVERNQVPLVVETSSSPKITTPPTGNKWTFRLKPILNAEAMFGDDLVKRGFTKNAYLALNNDWGRAIVEEFGKTTGKAGAKTVATDYYGFSETNFYPFLSKYKTADVTGLMLNGGLEAFVLMVKQSQELGLKAPRVLLTGADLTALIEKAGAAASEGVYQVTQYDLTDDTAPNREFLAAWRKKHPTVVPDELGPVSGYIAVKLIADAVKRANSTAPAAVRDALTKTNLETPIGTLKFDENNQAWPKVYLKQVQNGKVVVLSRKSF